MAGDELGIGLNASGRDAQGGPCRNLVSKKIKEGKV